MQKKQRLASLSRRFLHSVVLLTFTFKPLAVMLSADIWIFKLVESSFRGEVMDLKNFFNKPIRWRFKLYSPFTSCFWLLEVLYWTLSHFLPLKGHQWGHFIPDIEPVYRAFHLDSPPKHCFPIPVVYCDPVSSCSKQTIVP